MDPTVPKSAALLLDFVRQTEVGRSDRASYDVIYGHNQNKLSKPLTSTNVGDLVDMQADFTRNYGSSASGGYQIMRNTLQDLARELGLRGTQIFDPNLQDRLAYHLLKRRGYESYMAGQITRTEFGKRLAQEWASFPVLATTQGGAKDKTGNRRTVTRGQSYYAGDGVNKALVSPEQFEAILDRVKAAGNAVAVDPTPDPIVIEKPVVADPEELGTPPVKSKTVWTWFLTAIGAPLAAFGNLDWRVQMFIVAVIVCFAIYGIKRRADLFKAVKNLKAELG